MNSKHNDGLRNSLVRMSNMNKENVIHNVSRLGSFEQRDTSYRRNGMLNFGGRQMINLSVDFDYYSVGDGGPPVVG